MQWNCPKRCYCIIKLERNNNRTDRLFARRLATIYALSRSTTRIRWIPALIGFQNAHLCQQPSKYADVHTCTTVDTGRGWSSAFPAREVKGEGAWGEGGRANIDGSRKNFKSHPTALMFVVFRRFSTGSSFSSIRQTSMFPLIFDFEGRSPVPPFFFLFYSVFCYFIFWGGGRRNFTCRTSCPSSRLPLQHCDHTFFQLAMQVQPRCYLQSDHFLLVCRFGLNCRTWVS